MKKKEPSQSFNGVKLNLFDRIIVRISIETKNIQHAKMKLELVSPRIDGFSVDPILKSEEDSQPLVKKAKI